MLFVRRKFPWLIVIVAFVLAGPALIPALNRSLVAIQLVRSLAVEVDGALAWQEQPSAESSAVQARARHLTQIMPADARAHHLLGVSSLNANDAATATTAFTRALNLGIDQYIGYQQLGLAYRMAEEPQLAVAAWQASGDLRPALAWGNELLQPGKTEMARAVFKAMTEMGDNVYYRAEGYYRLGIAWAIDGRWDLALVELEQAYRIRPDHPATLVDLGRALYYTGGDRARAETLIARAAELQPDNQWIATTLAQMYTTVDEPERAAYWRRRLEHLNSQEAQNK